MPRTLATFLAVFGIFFFQARKACCQANPSTYSDVSFFIVAHPDDWQLFMGSDAYNTIQEFTPGKEEFAKRKAVFIYITAGNLHDDDDRKSCMCIDPQNPNGPHIPYWKVREVGANNSIHLAACRFGSKGGAPAPYAEPRVDIINGHQVINYHYKNTSSYFLRIKAGNFRLWDSNPQMSIGTVDSLSTYIDYPDVANTLYYIYKKEMGIDVPAKNPSFHFPDWDTTYNPGDHPDHYLSGKAAAQAAKMLSDEWSSCFPEHMHVGYDIQNLPENLSTVDVQNKAAITSAYCLSLLDHNAWAEWGGLYQEWCKRDYFRSISSCDEQQRLAAAVSPAISLVKPYPNPADKELSLKFSEPVQSTLTINISNMMGGEIFSSDTKLDGNNTLVVNTSGFPAGSYLVVISSGASVLWRLIVQVAHP